MPISYSLYYMEDFPEVQIGEIVKAPHQQVLHPEEFLSPPRTEFKCIRIIDELNVVVFSCIHEQQINQKGRARGISFPFFIGEYFFTSYYFRDKKLLLLKARKAIATKAMKHLNKNPQVEGKKNDIDLQSIIDLIAAIKGAYVTVDTSADVNSMALFGPSIDSDYRFDEALKDGRLYYVRLNFPYEDYPFHIGIGEDQGLVLFDTQLDEHSELALLLDIKYSILDKARPLV